MRIDQFENFHNFNNEIARMIVDKDSEKDPLIEKIYETVHTYIDFSDTIIGEKIKCMHSKSKRSDIPKFDDIYYSQYMLKSEDNNIDFYLQESV